MANTFVPKEFWSSVINFKTAAATLVVPAMSGMYFVPDVGAKVMWTTLSSPSDMGRLSIGNNATDYNNVHQPAASMTFRSTEGAFSEITLFVSGGRMRVDVGSVGIYANVPSGFAATGTTVSGRVCIVGYYMPSAA